MVPLNYLSLWNLVDAFQNHFKKDCVLCASRQGITVALCVFVCKSNRQAYYVFKFHAFLLFLTVRNACLMFS